MITEGTNSYFLIRVAGNIVSNFRARIANNATTLSAMVSPFTELWKFVFADLARCSCLIWCPLCCCEWIINSSSHNRSAKFIKVEIMNDWSWRCILTSWTSQLELHLTIAQLIIHRVNLILFIDSLPLLLLISFLFLHLIFKQRISYHVLWLLLLNLVHTLRMSIPHIQE